LVNHSNLTVSALSDNGAKAGYKKDDNSETWSGIIPKVTVTQNMRGSAQHSCNLGICSCEIAQIVSAIQYCMSVA